MEKGAEHVVDHMCHSRRLVAAGIGQWLHDGWSYSRSPGHRPRCGGSPDDPGPKEIVKIIVLAYENEAFGKRGGQQAQIRSVKVFNHAK